MNENKPEWYSDAKGGLGNEAFTEQMKQEVNRRIHERRPSRKKYGLWAAAAASAICIIAILLFIPTLTNDRAPSPAGTETPSIESTPPTPSPTESIPPTESPISTPEEQVQLAYRNVENTLGDYPVEVNRIEATRIAKSSVIVKRVIELGDLGNFIVYLKNEEDTELYAGMEILAAGPGSAPASDIYELGTAGEIQYLNDVEVTGSSLFGQFQVRIYGVCGANCATNNWIHFEEATPGVPISDFRLNSHVIEMDIDEDGTMEAIVQESSTISQVEIIKKINGQVKIADLNIALKADHPNSVIFDNEKRIFKALFPNRSLSYQYKKGEDALVLVEDSEAETDQDQLIVGGKYEGNDTIRLQVDGEAIDARWFKDPFNEFGLYIPESMKTVKFEDGYEYATKDGEATLSILNSDQASTPYLRKEKDLSRYSEYIGSEFWGDDQSIRYDHFSVELAPDYSVRISIRTKTAQTEQIRPLLLAVISNIAYAPAE